jgi:signal transduction histidine kinase
MRQILGALRPEGDAVEYGPQPTAADIPSLIDNLRRIGHDVTLQVNVRPGTTSTLMELGVYRIVQEALSNIVRHAPGATVSVVVLTSTRNLRVAVVNGRAPRAASPPVFNVGSEDRGGNGLRGMRERVELLGGTIEYGPSLDGGYAIEALLPLTPSPQESP